MTTKLDKTIKREVTIDGEAHTVAMTAEGFKITRKGHRTGTNITWQELVKPAPEHKEVVMALNFPVGHPTHEGGMTP